MCGWIGVFGSLEDRQNLHVAAETLASRGPDGCGERIISGGPLQAGLAHRRLAILDPTPAGAQPMYDGESCTSVVHNGEIYNFVELRAQLEAKGARFYSDSDTEVLLKGWTVWGDGLLDRIQGIFSFALVDESAGKILMARDRLGVKPLYWAKTTEGLVAGSAPRAILALRPELRGELDLLALAQYLTLLWIPHPRTPWKGVHKLPPGTALAYERGQLRQWRYWRPSEGGHIEPKTDNLREALEQATVAQLVSDVPIGILLSGGLDSTLLLSFMARHHHGELHALTAGFDLSSQRLEITPDDAHYARTVAAAYPEVTLTSVELDRCTSAAIDDLSFHFDDPVADPAAISLYSLAQASSTKVLISGVGGEELFAGYPRHLGLSTARRVAKLPVSVRALASRCSPALLGGQPGPGYAARRNAQKLIRAVAEGKRPHYWRMMSQLTMAELESLMPGCASEAFQELDGQTSLLEDSGLEEALSFDLSQFLPNLNLAYVDKAAMAAGVEVRVPLLDESLVELVTAFDPALLVDGSIGKVPLRRAARGLIPDAIVGRPKSGFGAPVRAWFRGKGGSALRERIAAAGETGLVDRAAALRLVDRVEAGKVDSALAAWALVCLEAWWIEHARGRR